MTLDDPRRGSRAGQGRAGQGRAAEAAKVAAAAQAATAPIQQNTTFDPDGELGSSLDLDPLCCFELTSPF